MGGGRRLLVRDLEQLATPAGTAAPLRGGELGEVDVIEDAYVLCAGGSIEAVGRMRDLPRLDGEVEEIDGRGLCAIPGLVDCHTHAVLCRRPRGGVRAPRVRRVLRGAARGGRRNHVHRPRDACSRSRGARSRRAHAPQLDAARGDDDVRGEIRLRPRPRHRARVVAGDPRRGRGSHVARRTRSAARVRRRGCVPRLHPDAGAPGCRQRSRRPPTCSSSAARSTPGRRGAI